MKIRLSELRRIIREAIGGPEDLAASVMLSAGGGVAVVYNPDVLLGSALRGALEPAEAIAGYVRLIDMSKYCSGAWELSEMWGPGRGDMLMDIAFAMTPNGRLVPDRMDVSAAASKMLRRASERGDVTLEDLPPKCKSHHDEEHLKKIYSSSGDPDSLEALKARHRAVMEDLKNQGVDTEELQATLLDAGPAKFSGSIVRLGELRRIIRDVLEEDRESFLSASEPIVKGKGPSAPRDIKRLWNAEADHGFFAGLTKVHWIRRYLDLRFFDKGGSRDEVSVGLYLPGQKLSPASAWMEPGVGVVLQGRVTLASNDMGSIWTGYADEAQPQHTKTSGAVRRGTMMNMSALEDYIIDASSFKEAGSMGNEGVLDNWRPVAIVMTDVGAFNPDVIKYVKSLVDYGSAFKGMNVVDQNMKPLDLDAALEELYRED